MTRTRLLRQARGRWLAAAVAAAAAATAAGLIVVRRGARDRDQADSTPAGTEPAEGMAPGGGAVTTRLRQARTAASSRIRAAGGVARRELSREGSGTPGEPEAAETAPPAAGTPAAALDHEEAAPSAGNGSAAQSPAADELPARDR
jgi:hypothetical protein